MSNFMKIKKESIKKKLTNYKLLKKSNINLILKSKLYLNIFIDKL